MWKNVPYMYLSALVSDIHLKYKMLSYLDQWEMSWNTSLTLSQLGTKSLHIYARRWIFISAITQHETQLQRKSVSVLLTLAQNKK